MLFLEGDKEWKKKKVFGKEDLLLLCHFFYLPYEDGEKAREIISQFKWLKDNAIDYQKPPIQEKVGSLWRKKTLKCELLKLQWIEAKKSKNNDITTYEISLIFTPTTES